MEPILKIRLQAYALILTRAYRFEPGPAPALFTTEWLSVTKAEPHPTKLLTKNKEAERERNSCFLSQSFSTYPVGLNPSGKGFHFSNGSFRSIGAPSDVNTSLDGSTYRR